jgi:hypothetical protein
MTVAFAIFGGGAYERIFVERYPMDHRRCVREGGRKKTVVVAVVAARGLDTAEVEGCDYSSKRNRDRVKQEHQETE